MSKRSCSCKVFTALDHKLQKLDKLKHSENLLTGKNCFTRKKRKLSFIEDMKILMSIGSSSLKKQLFDYFDYDINAVSLPGFIRSRVKIKEEAFRKLMDMMNKAYPCNKTYKGYRLMAVDGSELPVSTDINDIETHCDDSSKDGHDSLHINAVYDVLNHRYIDNIVQPIKKKHEINAMIDMAGRYEGDKAIFLADRFYSGFNCIENIRHTGHRFLIRIKDVTSYSYKFKCVPSVMKDSEFDEDIRIIFTNKRTREILAHPEIYKVWADPKKRFDFLDEDNHFYEADYRVVRFHIGGEEAYETIITNLDRESFPAGEIRKLYNLRWGIEVSYRHLKYSVDLNALHSKRRDFIRQEIWARMIMFNISMIIIDYVQDRKTSSSERKWEYAVNITMAIFFVRNYMVKRKDGRPPDLENLIASQILPIRPGRHYARNVKSQPYVSFGYRFN